MINKKIIYSKIWQFLLVIIYGSSLLLLLGIIEYFWKINPENKYFEEIKCITDSVDCIIYKNIKGIDFSKSNIPVKAKIDGNLMYFYVKNLKYERGVVPDSNYLFLKRESKDHYFKKREDKEIVGIHGGGFSGHEDLETILSAYSRLKSNKMEYIVLIKPYFISSSNYITSVARITTQEGGLLYDEFNDEIEYNYQFECWVIKLKTLELIAHRHFDDYHQISYHEIHSESKRTGFLGLGDLYNIHVYVSSKDIIEDWVKTCRNL